MSLASAAENSVTLRFASSIMLGMICSLSNEREGFGIGDTGSTEKSKVISSNEEWADKFRLNRSFFFFLP